MSRRFELRPTPLVRSRRRAVALGVALALLAACGPGEPPGADLILTGGMIRTQGTGAVSASALAIDDGTVVDVGSDAEIRALAGDDTQEMELDGATVLPGFVDAWADPEAVGRWSDGLDLRGSATPREVRARVREAAAVDPDGDWIVGFGWDETRWPTQELPAADLLEEFRRPVVLYRHDGDVAWINQAAARAAAIEAADRLRDASGTPTDLVTGPALERVRSALGSTSSEQRREWIAAGLRQAVAAGMTGLLTAPVDAPSLAIYRRLARDEDLPLRVGLRLLPGLDADRIPDELPPLLQIVAVGASLDGPFRPPLAGLEGDGASRDRAERLAGDLCQAAAALRLPAHAHARGDAAVLAAVGCPSIASGEGLIVGADLLPAAGIDALRNARVAVVPLRMAHDLYWLDELLGAERAARAHAYADLATGDRLVALASAAPAHPQDHMAAIQVTLRRRDLEGYPLDAWHPTQRLDLETAIRAARAPAVTTSSGPLGRGAPADLVVWSNDPFDASISELPQARAMLTVVAGRVSFSRPLVQLDFEKRP